MSSDTLVKYLQYIRNTGYEHLPVAMFDEDWEPIGPMLRQDLIQLGWIETKQPNTICITQAGQLELGDD